ncbi:MAG: peptide-methionine (S)-S-oxide reductase MsrA, partial [Halofilum sp. (in: g-proteobacteria)]
NVGGVIEVESGYIGGECPEPSYKQVCSGQTGHAEAVRVEFDPAVIGYDALLDVFWRSHDPTQLNRQGPDIGSQYRSAIFYLDEAQREMAEASRSRVAESYREPIATEIAPAGPFYRAEEYHQRYFEKHGAVC